MSRIKTNKHVGLGDINDADLVFAEEVKNKFSLPVTVDGHTPIKWSQYSGATSTTVGVEAFMLIDKSKILIYPHTTDTTIVIDKLILSLETPATTWTSDLQIGFLSGVTASDGTLEIIKDLDLPVSKNIYLDMKFEKGISLGNMFGVTTAGLTAFNTGTSIDAANGELYACGNGDLVLYKTAGAQKEGLLQFDVMVGYHTVQ